MKARILRLLSLTITVLFAMLTWVSAQDLIFADWLALDLSLAAGSPAIDTGNPDGATTHDITGLPRDAQPDVGAYEEPLP